MRRNLFFILPMVIVISMLTFGSGLYAANYKLIDKIDEAEEVLKEIMRVPEKSIPTDLFSRCKAIAIFPSTIRGGFIFGARYGKGVILAHDEKTGQWSGPAFFTIAGGSWGFQIGAQSIDLILMIMNERGLRGLLQTKFTLGGDVGVSAGPVGRGAEASTDLSLKAGILSYSRSRGLFAGITLKGAVIKPNNDANSSLYGRSIFAEEILKHRAESPPCAQDLRETLSRYSSAAY